MTEPQSCFRFVLWRLRTEYYKLQLNTVMSVSTGCSSFETEPGFCGNCGTILPLVSEIDSIKCMVCHTHYGPEAYGLMESYYVINFHSPQDYMESSEKSDESTEGPVISRKCPKCGNDKMSYSTVQLRSADEGQTVFYKCIKCKFSESENS